MPLAPIWKDRTVQLSASASATDYEIRIGSAAGTLIYSGRAYRRPGEAGTRARINDVCADWLSHTFPGPGFSSSALAETFVTVVEGIAVDTVTFVNDWSYEDRTLDRSIPLSAPVLPELDPLQDLIFSVLPGAGEVPVLLTFLYGTTQTIYIQTAVTADFNNDFNDDFAKSNIASRPGTVLLDLSRFTGLASVSFGGLTMRVRAQNCPAEYIVAYVNAYGGWDTLLLDGTVTRRDDLTRHTALNDYDNADPTARGLRYYAIEVAPAWTLRTGLLTDEQSARMHHLLNSPCVYLYSADDGIWRPVILTDQVTEYKTRKGNGRAPVQYTFNAQLAQERFRR